jgi:hypothetical protein
MTESPSRQSRDPIHSIRRASFTMRSGAQQKAADSGRILNQYQTALQGVACGFAAVAMAAITFGLLVVAPATMESSGEATRILTAPQLLATPPAEAIAVAAQQPPEIEPALGCDKANRARPPEARCPRSQAAQQPAKSDSRGVGCLDFS